MAKDHDKYVYVEVALPRDNPAVQNLLRESEKTDIPLRVLVKAAAIQTYATDEDSDEERTDPKPKTAKPPTKKRTKNNDAVISDEAKEAASAFLDDLGF